jgi:DnaJ-class molecular chaperone
MAQCPDCGGTGKITEDGKVVDCPRCEGTGEYDAANEVKEPPKE